MTDPLVSESQLEACCPVCHAALLVVVSTSCEFQAITKDSIMEAQPCKPTEDTVSCADCTYVYHGEFCGTHTGSKHMESDLVLCRHRNHDGHCQLYKSMSDTIVENTKAWVLRRKKKG